MIRTCLHVNRILGSNVFSAFETLSSSQQRLCYVYHRCCCQCSNSYGSECALRLHQQTIRTQLLQVRKMRIFVIALALMSRSTPSVSSTDVETIYLIKNHGNGDLSNRYQLTVSAFHVSPLRQLVISNSFYALSFRTNKSIHHSS